MRLLGVGFVALVTLVPSVHAASIEIRSGQGDYAICHLDIPLGQTRDWSIVAQRGTLFGIGDAEFRIEGWPPGYFHVVTPNPLANVVLGDPLGGGCNIAFPSTCETSASLVLFTVVTVNISGTPGSISVLQHSSPSNPNFSCPRLGNICDPPMVTSVCVPTSTTYINQGTATVPADPFPGDTDTNVGINTQLSWVPGHPGSECVIGIPGHRIYLGTNPNPPLVGTLSPLDNSEFAPGTLLTDTTYYWRVESIDEPYGISGPLWSFTTTDVVAVEETTWESVKNLYR